LEATDVTVLCEDGDDDNYGLYNRSGAGAVLHGGSFIGRGGDDSRGIYNYGSGTTLEATSATVLGEDGSISNYGLYLGNGMVYLGVAQLDSGAYNVIGTLTCFQAYDENYASYTCP
jgi:hypothetical protein